MIEAVRFHHLGQRVTSIYRRSDAVLPVLDNKGNKQLITWGRRYGETGQFAEMATLDEERLLRHEYDFYFYKRVKIYVHEIQMRNKHSRSEWLCGSMHYPYQGILAQDQHLIRVFGS